MTISDEEPTVLALHAQPSRRCVGVVNRNYAVAHDGVECTHYVAFIAVTYQSDRVPTVRLALRERPLYVFDDAGWN